MFYNPELKIETPKDPTAPLTMPDGAEAVAGRRPRIAIMGEFSAGKSTLTNLLIGSDALPVRVTATQLPPVWLSHGTGRPYGVDLDGERFNVDFDRIDAIPLQRTQYLRVERAASVLELCDIIDFPGISDPNMPAETWQRVTSMADSVIWCSHAVQAWRQSEAAVWEDMPPELFARSFLLLTRMDRLTEARDRQRVLARVRRETEGLFANVFPVSLTDAHAAGDDRAAWEASGAEDVMSALLNMLMTLSKSLGHEIPRAAPAGDILEDEAVPSDIPAVDGFDPEDDPFARLARVAANPGPERDIDAAARRPSPRIVPRRVSLKGSPRRHARPSADDTELDRIFQLR